MCTQAKVIPLSFLTFRFFQMAGNFVDQKSRECHNCTLFNGPQLEYHRIKKRTTKVQIRIANKEELDKLAQLLGCSIFYGHKMKQPRAPGRITDADRTVCSTRLPDNSDLVSLIHVEGNNVDTPDWDIPEYKG